MQILLDHYPALALGFCLAVALCVGSFLNVLIHRLPIMLQRQWQQECHAFLALDYKGDNSRFNLMLPRSRCPHCHTLIRAWQNIPVLSYLLLRGRCGHCREKIALRYPLVELSMALLCLACYWRFGFSPAFVASSLLCAVLLSLALIDIDTMLLPDQLTLPLVWLGLLLNSQAMFVPLNDALWGAVLGYLSLWSIYWLFKLLTGKEGMGYGDFKLLALLGAWFGYAALPFTILASSLAGAVVGIVLMLAKRHQSGQALPFGPYLVMGGLLYLFFGADISRAYWSIMGL